MLTLGSAHGWPRAALELPHPGRVARPANDNAMRDDPVLAAALRLFAANGLGAAERAQQLAMDAEEAGDTLAAERWSAVCHVLDRQRARQVRAWREARGR